MGGIAIRPAGIEDADAIAHVHVEAWRETYRGLLPTAVLDGLSIERHAAWWRQVLKAMAAWMLRRGYQGGSLWVLRKNEPARRFHQALGGIIVGRRQELEVFRAALGEDVEVERIEHLLKGARHCTYRVRPST